MRSLRRSLRSCRLDFLWDGSGGLIAVVAVIATSLPAIDAVLAQPAARCKGFSSAARF